MPRLSRRAWAGLVALVLVIGLGYVTFSRPVPYVTFAPGPTVNVLSSSGKEPIIEVSGHQTYDDGGALRLVTVIPSQPGQKVGLTQLIKAWVDPDVAVYPYNAIYPPDATRDSERQQSTVQMVSSQDNAVAAALDALGIEFARAVRIAGVDKDGPSAGKLKTDDVIVAIDGKRVQTLEQVTGLVQPEPVGTTLTLRVLRDGEERTEQVTTTTSTQDKTKSAIRVQIAPSYRFPFHVDLNIDDHIGGSSGGLVFALAIYDVLTPGSLTGGKSIAGTGEIDASGRVGAIGGIQQKIVGAQDDGAELFLVPAANCAEAVGAPYDHDKIRLVKVNSLKGALRDIEAWVDDPGTDLPQCTTGRAS